MTPAPATSLETLEQTAWDVIVIGAGPAGSVAAIQAARRGWKTLLVDAKPFPRRKACGGCLSHGAVDALRRLGLDALLAKLNAPRVDRIRFFSRRSVNELRLPTGYAIDRAELDAALAQAAVKSGAQFISHCTAKLLGAEYGWQRINLALPGNTLAVTTRVAAVADGLLRSSLHAASTSAAHAAPRSRIGVATLIATREIAPAQGTIEMSIAREGYAGAVSLDHDRTLIAAAFDRDLLKSHSLGEAVSKLLIASGKSAPRVLLDAEWMAAPPLTRRPAQIAGERWFAIGDSAGYVEPFTGDGMAAAIETATAVAPFLAAALHDCRPQLTAAWTATHRHLVRRRQFLCRGLAWTLRRPWAVSGLLALCRYAPGLASRTYACVQQTSTPRPASLEQAAIA